MTAKKKPLHRGNGAGASRKTKQSSQPRAKDAASQAQRDRIIEALRRRPQTSYDLRRLGCYQALARSRKLREKFGLDIRTSRVTLVGDGYTHPRAALYSLQCAPRGAV